MKSKFTLVGLMLLFAAAAVLAKPKPKTLTFHAPSDKVYSALVKVMKTHYVVKFVDDKQMIVTFLAPDRLEDSASVQDGPDGTSIVTLNMAVGDHWNDHSYRDVAADVQKSIDAEIAK